MTTEDELDALLGKPLTTVADDGFSHGVVTNISAHERAIAWFEWGTAAVLFVLVLLFVPWDRLTAPFENIAFDLGLSLPFAIACAALAFSHVGLGWFAEGCVSAAHSVRLSSRGRRGRRSPAVSRPPRASPRP